MENDIQIEIMTNLPYVSIFLTKKLGHKFKDSKIKKVLDIGFGKKKFLYWVLYNIVQIQICQ